MFSNSLWFILTISPNLCVKSSSDLSPLSKVILGLIVTGGIGNKDKTIHSGLDFLGFKPKIVTSSSFIFSNLILISIGKTLLSFSMTVVGFSKLILYCLALQ